MVKLIDILKKTLREETYALDYDDYPEDPKKYEKISPETIKKINSRDRIVLGTKDNIDLNFKVPPSKIGYKPTGLWYGFGTSWIDFIRQEIPDRETEHVFKIEVEYNSEDMITIDNDKTFLWFSKRFKDPENEGRFGNHKINWPEVTKKYKGIEFPIYFNKYRRDLEHDWYYPWDIASGCIWDLSAVKKVVKLQ